MASPVFFVKKKDGKLQFVQDYQKLNMMMVKNTYSHGPLLESAPLLESVQGKILQFVFYGLGILNL